MAFTAKDNSGALFINDRKEKDTHPDSTGTAMIDGIEYRVSAWRKEGKSGARFLSLAFTRKDASREGPKGSGEAASAPTRASTIAGDLDDAIPFMMER